jgi:nitroreductase
MDALECLHTRRSIRKYTDKNVSDDLIKQLLEAAMTAPSAGNSQPWHFVVIRDRKILDTISTTHEYSKMCKEVNCAILVCGDMKLNYKDFWVQDCSAATMNILYAVHALGLGAVWCGVYPVEKKIEDFKKFFKLPEDIIPLSLIPIGYPAQKSGRVERYKEERVHKEIW